MAQYWVPDGREGQETQRLAWETQQLLIALSPRRARSLQKLLRIQQARTSAQDIAGKIFAAQNFR